MAKSLNKVMLIGNLTRDPEMRYTPQGTAVVTFGIATNRNWTTDGEKKEDVEFHNIVAWNKLAEICANLLKKGRKVYVEGRLATRSWQGQDGAQKQRTEIIINDMVILDKKEMGEGGDVPDIDVESQVAPGEEHEQSKIKSKKDTKTKEEVKEEKVEEPADEDIPF